MWLIRFILSNKAQVLYSLLVLVFNVVAIYYLFFYSSTKINLAPIIPNEKNLLPAIEKPFQELFKKFVYEKPVPSLIPSPTIVPTIEITPIPTPANDLIDCTGPDGKTLWLTQKDCDLFNNAWKPTSSITPIASPSAE